VDGWLEDLLAELARARREGRPILVGCGICGTQVDVDDTVEAAIPSTMVRFDGIPEPFEFPVSRIDRVCGGCAAFASPDPTAEEEAR
jgi:hypothetical protein